MTAMSYPIPVRECPSCGHMHRALVCPICKERMPPVKPQ